MQVLSGRCARLLRPGPLCARVVHGLPGARRLPAVTYGRSLCSASGEVEREQMEYDIVIVGAGPAGLSAAIRAKQVAQERGGDVSVCVVEKGAEVGAHVISGNIFEPRALDELIPDWKERGAPLDTPVVDDKFYWLPTSKYAVRFPNMFFPPEMHQDGNYVISLGLLSRWLAEQAEEMGVEIFPGFAAGEPVINAEGAMTGIQLTDVGIAKDAQKKESFEPGMQLLAKQTILAEGCRGSLSEGIMERYNLREGDVSPQLYGLGVKEVWEVKPENHVPGLVTHSVGWPLDHGTYGGAFTYHMKDNLVHIGMIVGLDYKNPYLSPYQEFQKYKQHDRVRALLEGGKCIYYGARCVNEGGFQSIPKLTFPGGMLTGCSAGFLNMPKIKGSHTAMKTGMLAGEAAAVALLESKEGAPALEITQYEQNVRDSWVWSELKIARNAKPSFKYGLFPGLVYSGMSLLLARGREPWTFRWKKKDSECTEEAAKHTPIDYPKADGVVSFELLDNLIRSGVNHEHDQPAHLKVKPEHAATPLQVSLAKYAGPEGRFCPAKVYEYVPDETKGDGSMRLQINAQNCVHCKCCSIKTPEQYIKWTVPEGGGGPQYAAM